MDAKSLAADVESVRLDVSRLPRSREASLAITKLEEAEFWLKAVKDES